MNEIDIVAINEKNKEVLFGEVKINPKKINQNIYILMYLFIKKLFTYLLIYVLISYVFMASSNPNLVA